MEITKREIIASIVIFAIMLMIGFAISGKIADSQNDKNAEYQKAIQITDKDMFEYGMQTSVGNAFVYGDLEAVDSVTFDEIGGEYLYIKKKSNITTNIPEQLQIMMKMGMLQDIMKNHIILGTIMAIGQNIVKEYCFVV